MPGKPLEAVHYCLGSLRATSGVAVAGERTTGPRVFVVDDEQVIASTLTLILKQQGYEATAFFDPTSLIESCESALPALVISDVFMPKMTGIDMAIELQNRYPSCKVLLFSGQASTSELIEQARQKGHNFDILAKPVHPAALLEHVRSLTGPNSRPLAL